MLRRNVSQFQCHTFIKYRNNWICNLIIFVIYGIFNGLARFSLLKSVEPDLTDPPPHHQPQPPPQKKIAFLIMQLTWLYLRLLYWGWRESKIRQLKVKGVQLNHYKRYIYITLILISYLPSIEFKKRENSNALKTV